MKRIACVVGAACFLAATAMGQVTGVATINDYTINTFVAGSTSCTPINLVCPSVITANVSCTPGVPVMLLISPCACVGFPGNFPLPNSPCVAIPATPWVVTNQTFDLALGCPIQTLAQGVSDTTGNFSWSVAVPPGLCGSGIVFSFSTQALIFDPICGSWLIFPHLLLSQAYDVTITF